MNNFRSRRALNRADLSSARGEAHAPPDGTELGPFQLGGKRLELDGLEWGVFGILDGTAKVYASTKSESLAKLILAASGQFPPARRSAATVTAAYILSSDLQGLVASRGRIAAYLSQKGGQIDLGYYDLKSKINRQDSLVSLMISAQAGDFTKLVIESSCRLSRRPRELHRILQFLDSCGVEVVTVSESAPLFAPHPTVSEASAIQRQSADCLLGRM